MKQIKEFAAEFPNLRFHLQEGAEANIEKLLLEIDYVGWQDRQAVGDIIRSFRFTEAERKATRDGLWWKSLRIHPLQRPLLQLLKWYPKSIKYIIRAIQVSNRLLLSELIGNSAAFGWFALDKYEIKEVVDVGRCLMKMWLFLNHVGCGVQPFSFSALPVYHSHFTKLPEGWPSQALPLYRQLQSIMSEHLGGKEFAPVWAFRTGRSTPIPPGDTCLKKSVDDLCFLSADDTVHGN